MKNITVKELIRQLQLHHPDSEVSFAPLTFCRTKSRGDRFVCFEFNEVVVFEDDKKLVLEKSAGIREA